MRTQCLPGRGVFALPGASSGTRLNAVTISGHRVRRAAERPHRWVEGRHRPLTTHQSKRSFKRPASETTGQRGTGPAYDDSTWSLLRPLGLSLSTFRPRTRVKGQLSWDSSLSPTSTAVLRCQTDAARRPKSLSICHQGNRSICIAGA